MELLYLCLYESQDYIKIMKDLITKTNIFCLNYNHIPFTIKEVESVDGTILPKIGPLLHGTVVTKYKTGTTESVSHYRYDKLHHPTQPARVIFYETGEIYSVEYKINGEPRKDRPFYQMFNTLGDLTASYVSSL